MKYGRVYAAIAFIVGALMSVVVLCSIISNDAVLGTISLIIALICACTGAILIIKEDLNDMYY